MPKIRTYDSQARIQGPVSIGRTSPDDFGAGVGRTISAIGGRMQRDFEREEAKAQAALERKKERDAAMWAEKTLAQGRVDFLNRQEALRQEADPTVGTTTTLLEEWDAWADDAAGKAPTPDARDRLELGALRARSALFTGAVAYDARAGAAHRKNQFLTTAADLENAVTLDPAMLGDTVEQLGSLADTLGMKSDQRDTLVRQHTQSLYGAAFDGMYRNADSPAAVAALERMLREDGQWQDNMGARDFSRALDALDTRQEQLQNKAAAAYKGGFKAALGKATLQGEIDEYPEAEIAAVMPADEAEEMIQARRSAVRIGEHARKINVSTPAEIGQMAASLRARVSDPSNSPEDVVAASQELGAFTRALTARQKAVEDDPVAFVLQHNDDAAGLYEQLQQNPEDVAALEGYVAAVTADQAHLGVPADERRLLTAPWVEQIKARMGEVATQEDGAQKALDTVHSLQMQFGEHWPTVYKQLSQEKAISGVTAVAARLPVHRSGEAMNLLLAGSVGEKALKEMLPAGVSTEGVGGLNDIVDTAMDQMKITYSAHLGGEQVINDHKLAIRLGAMRRLATGSASSIDDAVEQTFAGIVGADFNFVGNLAIPTEYEEDEMLFSLQQNLRNEVTALDIIPPRSLLGFNEEVSAEAAMGRLIEDDGHIWLTSPDGRGVTLMWPGAVPVEYTDANGQRQRVQYTWDELRVPDRSVLPINRGRRG